MCPKRDIKAKYEASMDKKKANKQTNNTREVVRIFRW